MRYNLRNKTLGPDLILVFCKEKEVIILRNLFLNLKEQHNDLLKLAEIVWNTNEYK